MEHSETLVRILVLLASATCLGIVLERLGQNAILGYLLAGVLLGPNSLHIVEHQEEVELLAELGVAMLLFTIGLEFSWRQLRRLGRFALAGGTMQVILTMTLGVGVTALLVGALTPALIVGGMVALSSTACVLGIFAARAEMDSPRARNALGILLIQDLAVIPLVMMVDILGQETSILSFGKTLAIKMIALLPLLAVFYVVFQRLAPAIFLRVGLIRNRELPILLAVITALGAALAAEAFDLSPALGAFIAGMLLAASPFAHQIRSDVVSLKTLLVTLFFSSIGMFADPAWMLEHAPGLLGLSLLVIVGKTLVVVVIGMCFKLPLGLVLATGLSLAQIGEFSFVLAQAGYANGDGILSLEQFRWLISITIITLFVTPYLIQVAPRLDMAIERKRGLRTGGADESGATELSASAQVILVGFGPAGIKVGEQVRELACRVTVIDQNPQITRAVNDYGFTAQVGDARREMLWEHLKVERADLVVITLPDPKISGEIVVLLRRLAPEVPVIVRGRYNRYMEDLRRAGARVVVDEEIVVGKELAQEISTVLKQRQAQQPLIPADTTDGQSTRSSETT